MYLADCTEHDTTTPDCMGSGSPHAYHPVARNEFESDLLRHSSLAPSCVLLVVQLHDGIVTMLLLVLQLPSPSLTLLLPRRGEGTRVVQVRCCSAMLWGV
jgi:hypothetical protein